jgi:hypothetical protein
MKCVGYDSAFALDIEAKYKAAFASGSLGATKRKGHPKKQSEGSTKESEGRRRGSFKERSKPLLPGPSSSPMESQTYDPEEDDLSELLYP